MVDGVDKTRTINAYVVESTVVIPAGRINRMMPLWKYTILLQVVLSRGSKVIPSSCLRHTFVMPSV